MIDQIVQIWHWCIGTHTPDVPQTCIVHKSPQGRFTNTPYSYTIAARTGASRPQHQSALGIFHEYTLLENITNVDARGYP